MPTGRVFYYDSFLAPFTRPVDRSSTAAAATTTGRTLAITASSRYGNTAYYTYDHLEAYP
jgi:hypothetical protein